MPPRNHTTWLKKPKVEAITSKCYNNFEVYEQEIERIFSKVWVPVFHKSEIKEVGSFRTSSIAGQNIITIKFDNRYRTFYNKNVQAVSGNDLSLCYHAMAWGELPCEVKHGGMIWTTLNKNPTMSVEEWTAGAFDCIADAIDTEELEVFHYHKAVIDTNYKLWHDTNSEFYHDFMHYFNRVSGFNDEYFARKNIPFDNGHVNVSSFTVNYEEYDGFEDRGE